jgi:transcription-repair coupling factor (superfamily II helicase)
LEGCKNTSRRTKHKAIKLVYADNDIVYVSIHSYKISKYNGKDGTPQNLQIRFECLEDFKTKPRHGQTFNLIQLYAKKTRKGFQFAPDSYLQNELESSFIYEDTPDKPNLRQSKSRYGKIPDGSLGLWRCRFWKTKLPFVRLSKQLIIAKQVAILVQQQF